MGVRHKGFGSADRTRSTAFWLTDDLFESSPLSHLRKPQRDRFSPCLFPPPERRSLRGHILHAYYCLERPNRLRSGLVPSPAPRCRPQPKPAHGELIRQAAQGEVLHNDDTTMKILALMKEANETGGRIRGKAGTNGDLHLGHCFDRRWSERSRSFSQAINTPAKICRMSWRSGHRNSVRRFRCAMRFRVMCLKSSRCCSETVRRTADANLWTCLPIFPRSAVTCSRRSGTFIRMMPSPKSKGCQTRSASPSIRLIAVL